MVRAAWILFTFFIHFPLPEYERAHSSDEPTVRVVCLCMHPIRNVYCAVCAMPEVPRKCLLLMLSLLYCRFCFATLFVNFVCFFFFIAIVSSAPLYTSNDDDTQSSCVRVATATMNAFQSLGLMNFSLIWICFLGWFLSYFCSAQYAKIQRIQSLKLKIDFKKVLGKMHI